LTIAAKHDTKTDVSLVCETSLRNIGIFNKEIIMERKFFSSALLSLALIFVQNAYADMPPKPAKCPSATSIASVGIELVEKDQNGTWAAGVLSNTYNTNDKWTFAVGPIVASNSSEARGKAIESLSSLSFNRGPIAVEQYNVWACLYRTDQGFMGVAVTPAFGLKPALHLVK
jgi:hypothetical protein